MNNSFFIPLLNWIAYDHSKSVHLPMASYFLLDSCSSSYSFSYHRIAVDLKLSYYYIVGCFGLAFVNHFKEDEDLY